MASTRIASFVATTVLGLTAPLSGQVAPPSADPALPARPAAAERFNLGLRGVYFVENQGQWSDASVHYGLKSRGLDVAFRESSFTMHLARECASTSRAREEAGFAPSPGSAGEGRRGGELLHHTNYEFNLSLEREALLPHGRGSSGEPAEYEHLTLTVTFPGSNPVAPRGAQPQTAKFNYFVGGEGRGIASNVPSFGAVIYENLYNGIDSLCVEESGDLRIATSFGTLMDSAPLVWQEDADSPLSGGTAVSGGTALSGGTAVPAAQVSDVDRAADHGRDARATNPINGRDARATRDTIPARFELINTHTYRIALEASPDPTLPLVIDPELEWMYYLGGSGSDYGLGIAVDGAGNSLVAGYTSSTDFDGRNNAYHGGNDDAFVVKVSASGSLQWMTYLGGSNNDLGYGIAVDGAGNAMVTGETYSTNFEGRNNASHGNNDAFVVKVSASGILQWMTYLGGTYLDKGYGIVVDSAGNALVTGHTWSSDFEGRNNVHHATWDVFVVKVIASGALQWMTYLGGSGWDLGYGIAVDSAGNSLVTGWTDSNDFEGRNNAYRGSDAFVVKVSASGALQWMTYLGGSNTDYGEGIAVDSAGNALVTGGTSSTDFEGRNNAYHGVILDAFVVKVSASGVLQWMTYLGGSLDDFGYGITVDIAGNALLSGNTSSTDFEGRNNAHHGGNDAFVVKVSASGTLQWITYVGGSGDEEGYGIAVDSAGNALMTGLTDSTDFEGRNNANHGSEDAFVVKLRVADGPQLTVAPTCPSGGPIQIEWSGASPGGQVALIFARNTGSFIIPNNRPCAGTTLGLGSNQIQLAWQGGAGQNGSRTLNTTAGPGACGGYLQLLDLTTCSASNVARIE